MQTHTSTSEEVYRKKVLELSETVAILKKQLADETEAKYKAYKKIAYLTSN